MQILVRHAQRVAVLIAGGLLVLVGIALLVLPGPGLLVIVGGLAVLSTEFEWAEGLLVRLKERVSSFSATTWGALGDVKQRLRRFWNRSESAGALNLEPVVELAPISESVQRP